MKKDNLQDAMKDIDPKLVKEASGSKGLSKKSLMGIGVSVLSFVLVAAIVLSAVLIIPKFNKGGMLSGGDRSGSNGKEVLVIPDPGEGSGLGEKLGDGVIKGSPYAVNDGGAVDGKLSDDYKVTDGDFGGLDSTVKRGEYPDYLLEPEVPAAYPEPEGYPYGEGAYPDITAPYPGYNNEIKVNAGTLTAGEWRDRDNLEDWLKLINDNNWFDLLGQRQLYSNRVLKVHVADGENVCFNVKVEAYAGEELLAAGRTDINGDVVLAYDILGNRNLKPDTLKILGKETAVPEGAGEFSVDVSSEEGYDKPYKLDLMLMIDTTGSMGDELNYIAAELSDMVKRISASGQQLSIRVSVNFYRDDYDDYVVKYYDFRENIDECIAQLAQEYASGGGDWPEAVHKALSNAVMGHEWRADAVKLCFLVLDAPPHTESEVQGISVDIANSLLTASAYGVRIIPVYCSGDGGNETEFILRSYALVTSGTFIFLTDHSGIGNPHAEPAVGEYDVEFLNECMIRVTCEFMGLDYTAPVNSGVPVVQDNANGN
ncbi:MAG: VWA domain-containing protein [Clostridia bacterium]|nr:VWA domain-containing protein [Clostridia bacterium]